LGSFVAWALPLGGRAGFSQRESLGIDAAVTLLAWYAVIGLASFAGFFVAQRYLTRRWGLLESISDDTFYRSITVIAAIGVGICYLAVLIPDPDLIVRTIRDQQVNEVKRALYDNYRVGPYTLRYVSAIGGGIAAYRIITRRRIDLWDIANVVILGLAAFAAARLLIIVAALIAVALVYHHRPSARLSLPLVLCAAVVLFLALTPLNYVRNAGFYREKYDIHNPLEMNFSEIRAYVGSPFQVSVGVAEKDLSEGNNFEGKVSALGRFLRPSYFEAPQPFNPYYRGQIDIEQSLSTNSAFVDMYGASGLLAYPLIAMLCFAGALVVGHFFLYRSYVFIAGAAMLYAFTELWRISLFDVGVVHALVLVPLAIAATAGLWVRVETWRTSSASHQPSKPL